MGNEAEFILKAIKEKGENGKIGYKKLQEICANEFEGVRLFLKKLKEQGKIDFDGNIPSFGSVISLK
jgi:hypothetical protein